MTAAGSFVPKNRLSCHFPAARPVRPAQSNASETKKIICPMHAAHVGHMIGDWFNLSPLPKDLPHRGRGTARRRWKEFVTLTRLRGIAAMRCICNCGLYCCRLGDGESSSADDGTRSARPRGLGGDFEFLPLKSPRNPITPIETSRVSTLHPGLYKNLRESARRVIGATAKPLYAIDGKAVGLDRRIPKTSLLEGGGPPQRWKE